MSSAIRKRLNTRLNRLELRAKSDHKPKSRAESPRAKMAKLDLHSWGKKYLGIYFTDASPKSHVALLRDLAGGTLNRKMRQVVVGSRGTAKSFVVSLLYVLACAVHGAEPYILIISETQDQAVALLAAIKTELEENADLAADYPDACGIGPVWNVKGIVLPNGVKIEAVGSGKRLRGRRTRQHRPSLVVLDDAESETHGNSREVREKSSNWFHKTVMKIGDGSTNFLVVGNAIQRDTLAMKLLEKPSWKGRTWKSIEKYPDRMDLWAAWESLYLVPDDVERKKADAFYKANRREMEAGAVLFWPKREGETLLELMKSRAEDRSSFESEKQCNPINPDSCEWGDKYFESLIWFDKWPKGIVLKTIAVDPSKGKEDKRGDYSAIVLLGRDRHGQLWIKCDMKKRDATGIVVDAVDHHIHFQPDRAVIETNQFQSLFVEDLAAEAESQGYVADFEPMENVVKKIVRIRRLTPYLSRKKLNFFNDAGTKLLVAQLRDFPVGSHDDGPDALEMAIRAAVEVFNVRSDGGGGNSRVAFDVD